MWTKVPWSEEDESSDETFSVTLTAGGELVNVQVVTLARKLNGELTLANKA